ncbi:Guanylate kinase [Babesia sp. Xinjiang]|uniref:Guanylate kinase n=1 Tax=Babesia sp. Xinjiang TaxID=462227 RepID=UPI000A242CCF|nr:Guanylate kinase [Babesia sp. Xinjiang]ORM41671.1 Guanylate kinase [Babesia sp. Xinjiang]
MAQVPFLVIVGPSGVGKGTLHKMLIDEFTDLFELSISCTTRAIRPSERHNVNYYFITNEAFEEMKAADAFLECASYVGNQYGTPVSEISRIQAKGKVPLLEIEMCGFKKLKDKGIPLYSVFVTTSDVGELRSRLVSRGSHKKLEMEQRLERALEEIDEAKTSDFSITIVNETLEESYRILKEQVMKWYGKPSKG